MVAAWKKVVQGEKVRCVKLVEHKAGAFTTEGRAARAKRAPTSTDLQIQISNQHRHEQHVTRAHSRRERSPEIRTRETQKQQQVLFEL